MHKITLAAVVVATAFLVTAFVVRAPQSATASAPANASATINPSAMQSTIDVNALPKLGDYPL
jgi:hypothetical protein